MHFNFAVTESRNDGMTESPSRNHGVTEGHGKSSIVPLIQSGAILIIDVS